MDKELLYQDKKIFYRIEGSGPPVLLIHGFGEDGTIWDKQIEFLKDRFHLIVPDLPGSGRSEMIEDMSMEGMAEVIKAIAPLPPEEASPNPSEGGASDSATSKKVFKLNDPQNPPSGGRGAVIGHSMGGYIALAFAEKYPEYISGLGLFHSSAFADSEEKKVTRRKGIEFIEQHGAFEFLKTAIPNLFSPQTKEERPEMVAEFIQKQHNFLPECLVSYYRAMMKRPDRTSVLKNSVVPVLFIMGKYDNAVPLQDGLKQCHLPENSYIHVLRATGHMGMLEEPGSSNNALEEFLLQI